MANVQLAVVGNAGYTCEIRSKEKIRIKTEDVDVDKKKVIRINQRLIRGCIVQS